MVSYMKVGTFGLVLLVLAVTVLGAPSNSTSEGSGGIKKSGSPSHTLLRSGSTNGTRITQVKASRVNPSNSGGNSGSQVAPGSKGSGPTSGARGVNSTRVARSPPSVVGAKKSNSTRVARGAPSSSSPSPVPVKGSLVLRGKNSTRVARGAPSSPAPVKGQGAVNARKSNSTRVVREAEETEVEGSEGKEGLKTVTRSPTAQLNPNTHPLFANRQSSNITNSLRPKLRTHTGTSSSETSEEEQDHKGKGTSDLHESSGGEDETAQVAPSHKRKSSNKNSEDEDHTVSVISSGPVAVHSRNSSRPALKGAAGLRRGSTSTTAAPIKEEEIEVFII